MRFRQAKLATALLATTTLGVGVIEVQANLAARAELDRLLARHHGLTVDSIFAEPLTGRVILGGVRMASGDASVAIGTLNLPLAPAGFSLITPAVASPFDDKPDAAKPDEGGTTGDAKPEVPKQEAPTAAAPTAEAPTAEAPAGASGTASADNITIHGGTTIYRIKHIDMTGTSLSNADLTALFEANNTEPLEARLKKLNATAIVVPEVLADDTTPGSEHHVSMNQVLLSGVAAGKIAAGSAAGITLTSKEGDDDVHVSVGPIQAAGVDLPQIVHVFGSVRSDDAEPILPLFDSVTATSFKVTNVARKVAFTLGTLKETGLKGRPLKTDTFVKQDGAETMTEAEKAALYDDVSHSFEIGSMQATEMAGSGDTGSYSLASISMQDFVKAKIGGFAMRAFRFEGPDAQFGIASLDVGPFALPPPKNANVTTQGASMMMPSAAKIDVGQIDFDGKGDGTDASGAPNRVKFKLAHAGFVAEGDPGDLPKTAKMTVDNFTIDVPAVAGQVQPLYEMGYRKLDISMGLATLYDPAAQSLMIHDLTVNGVSMGSLALGLHLVNVTKGLVSQNQEVVKASALAILAKGITLDIVNDGLVEKVIDWKAKQDGMDVAKEKDFLIDLFETKLPASFNNSANAKIIGSAAAKFVAAPKTLHVSIESKSGLGVGSMALLSDPGLLIDSLDVKATANE